MAIDDDSSDMRAAAVADATNSAIYRHSEAQLANESIVARQRVGQAELKATVGRCEKANELPRNRILARAYAAALDGAK